MKSLITTLAAMAVATSFAAGQDAKPAPDPKVAAGDGGKPAATAPAPVKPAADAAAKPKRDPQTVFSKRDSNSDGGITLEEFKAGMKDTSKAEQAFKRRDKDGDGKITLEEFKAPVGKKKQQ
jgi:hypothetical protein